MSKQILKTFRLNVTLELNNRQYDEALKALNLFYLNDEECNITEKDGRIVSKYPEIEKKNPEFQASHYNANRSYDTTVLVDLYEDGTLRIHE